MRTHAHTVVQMAASGLKACRRATSAQGSTGCQEPWLRAEKLDVETARF
jgi:hypothetical protein